jgi:hypothetical protein
VSFSNERWQIGLEATSGQSVGTPRSYESDPSILILKRTFLYYYVTGQRDLSKNPLCIPSSALTISFVATRKIMRVKRRPDGQAEHNKTPWAWRSIGVKMPMQQKR